MGTDLFYHSDGVPRLDILDSSLGVPLPDVARRLWRTILRTHLSEQRIQDRGHTIVISRRAPLGIRRRALGTCAPNRVPFRICLIHDRDPNEPLRFMR